MVFPLSIKHKPKFNRLLTHTLSHYNEEISKKIRCTLPAWVLKECCCINRQLRGTRTRHTLFIKLRGQLSCYTLQTVIQWAIQTGLKGFDYISQGIVLLTKSEIS